MKPTHKALSAVAAVALILITGRVAPAQADPGSPGATASTSYLPIAIRAGGAPPVGRVVNVPMFNTAVLTDTPAIEQMAIFWFGKVTPSDNYVDVRVGYNATEISFYIAVVDRLLWNDDTPSANDLTQWDGLSLYLHRGPLDVTSPTAESFRFDMQWGAQENAPNYMASYRGDGSDWVRANVAYRPFTTYRGDKGPNSGGDIRGWAAIYSIPFASLGTQKPADGAVWRLALANHDRDSGPGATAVRTTWPESIEDGAPSTWGALRFGLPAHSPAASTPGGSVLIRHGLNGAVVKDGNVGGYTWCGGDPATFWTEWGLRTWSFYNPDISDFNIQNQLDIADWPCFAKYYITFPLDQLPQGKVIRSAKLTINQAGNVSPPEAPRSYLQIFTVAQDFNQSTLNWNNGPLAVENVSQAWVDPIWFDTGTTHPREFDLSYAVAQAYQKGIPLRLAIYSADRPYHSGKYFISSASWYQTQRPRLNVEWGNP